MAFCFCPYPGFLIAARHILFFVRVRDTYVLWVFHGTIVYFCPDDPDDFLSWLLSHQIHQLPDAVPAG